MEISYGRDPNSLALVQQILEPDQSLIDITGAVDALFVEGHILPEKEGSSELLYTLLSPKNDWKVLIETISACLDYRVFLGDVRIKDLCTLLLDHEECYVRLAARRFLDSPEMEGYIRDDEETR